MKTAKRFLCTLLAAILALSLAAAPAFAGDVENAIQIRGGGIKVTLGGEYLNFDVKPQIIGGRTMVPLRAIFEALEATVAWDGATQTVTSTKDGTTVQLTIGNPTMYVDGNAVTLDSPACIVDGRTLVPVRAISEAFQLKVDWSGATRTVKIRKTASLPLVQTDENGQVIYSYTYDEKGNCLGMTSTYDYSNQYQYDANGNCTYYADSYGWEKCTYDEANNRIYHETAYGDKTTYDTNGNILHEEWSDGYSSNATYDENSNLLHWENSYGYWTNYTYDANGNLIYQAAQDGSWDKYTYDAYGRKSVYENSYARTETYTYDANGNLIYVQYPDSWEKYEYDANSNLIFEEDGYGFWMRYTYDPAGRLLKTENSYGNGFTYTYDANGNMLTEQGSDGTDNKYTYDASGNLIRFESAYGSVTTYTYDAAGNLIEEQYRDSDGAGYNIRYVLFEL